MARRITIDPVIRISGFLEIKAEVDKNTIVQANPSVKGEIHGIEVEEVEFGLGLSCRLQGELDYISKKILKDIESILAKKIVK